MQPPKRFYLRSAKFFTLLGSLFGIASIVCIVATLIQIVRGFFDHSQWWFVIGWLFGDSICFFLAQQYFATGRQYIRDGEDAGEIK